MSQTFKDVADKQLQEKVGQMKQLQTQLPYFFRMSAWNTEDSIAFKPLDKKPSAEQFHSTIKFIQQCLKDTRTDAREWMCASKELLQFVTEAFGVLVTAYEVQGRIIMKMAEHLKMDPDEMIADLMMERSPAGDKAAQYVADNFEAPKEAEKTNGQTQEDNTYSMPF